MRGKLTKSVSRRNNDVSPSHEMMMKVEENDVSAKQLITRVANVSQTPAASASNRLPFLQPKTPASGISKHILVQHQDKSARKPLNSKESKASLKDQEETS